MGTEKVTRGGLRRESINQEQRDGESFLHLRRGKQVGPVGLGYDLRHSDWAGRLPATRLHGAKNLLQETTMKVTFDYEKLGCQYPRLYAGPVRKVACNAPIVAFGWWSTTGKKGGLRLCQEHLEFILEKEKRP